MTIILILLLGWCLFWWGIALVQDIMGDMIWDKDLNAAIIESNSPKVIKALGIIMVALIYVATAPITKPYFWIDKELSKRRMRKAVSNIKSTFDKCAIKNPDTLRHIRQLEEEVKKVCQRKDQEW